MSVELPFRISNLRFQISNFLSRPVLLYAGLERVHKFSLLFSALKILSLSVCQVSLTLDRAILEGICPGPQLP